MIKTYFVKREFCPSCKSREYKTVYSCGFTESPIKEYLESFYSPQGQIELEYLKGAEYILDECHNCGMTYQKEIPNDFLMNKLYEEWIDSQKVFDQYEQSHNLDYYSGYAREIMMLIKYFNTVPKQLKFFDFGMGWGNWCQMAKAFGCDSYGTELSEARIEYAKSNGIKVISWIKIPNHSFDFINTDQVFEHIPDPLKTLYHLKKSLKPGGLIRISVPNGCDIKRKLRIMDWTAPKGSKNSLNSVAPLEHINCFNHSSIIRMADMAGFRLMEIPFRIEGRSFSQESIENFYAIGVNEEKFRKLAFGETEKFDTYHRKEAYKRELKERKWQLAEAHAAFGGSYIKYYQLKEAICELREAIKIDSGCILVQYHLGSCYQKVGRSKKAIECFQKVLQINTTKKKVYWAGAHFHLGEIYQKQGRLDEAKFEFEKCLELNPSHRKAKEMVGNNLQEKPIESKIC
ncbi:methyltransferase domain-containing protein [bacterium]|nr:methyltransferase domain-containing protein [bacterium]MBU1615872.1 methyltransferase domain-containing protein [bacterium]